MSEDQGDFDDEQFGELALVIGDFHIPMRAGDIPERFKDLLGPGKVQSVLCTGNVGNRETLDWIKSLCGQTHIVRGDFDEFNELPETKVVQIGSFKIGLLHGHQIIPWGDDEALLNEIRQLDCDILVTGHTHLQSISKIDKKYIINPGSVTGAYSPIQKDVIPSFMLLEFKEKSFKVYKYQLINDEEKIEVCVYDKQK